MRYQDPFLHPAISKVIKAMWYEGTSRKPALASRFNNKYQCSIEGCDEKEVPEAMVAVVATAVCTQIIYLLSNCSCYCQIEAALIDRSNQSSAGKVPRSDFSASTFGKLHTWHCELLGSIHTKNRHLYHRILSTIYKVVTSVSCLFSCLLALIYCFHIRSPTPSSSTVGFKVEDAMAQIDFASTQTP